MTIIDSHCHVVFNPSSSATDPIFQRYVSRARDVGITMTILFSSFHDHYAEANRRLSCLIRDKPDRFSGFAFVHADKDRGRIFNMIWMSVNRYGLKGIKAHRRDARITREICETARYFKLPVLYDIMGETSVVSILTREYPDVIFIIPHLGSFNDDVRVQKQFINHLSEYSNIYTDTSGVRYFDLLVEALEKAGPGKILFGTDGPWLHPGVELEKIYSLKLSPAAEKLVLCENAQKLLRIPHHDQASVLSSAFSTLRSAARRI